MYSNIANFQIRNVPNFEVGNIPNFDIGNVPNFEIRNVPNFKLGNCIQSIITRPESSTVFGDTLHGIECANIFKENANLVEKFKEIHSDWHKDVENRSVAELQRNLGAKPKKKHVDGEREYLVTDLIIQERSSSIYTRRMERDGPSSDGNVRSVQSLKKNFECPNPLNVDTSNVQKK